MQVRLETRVEVEGATFWFGATDRTLGPLIAWLRLRVARTGEETLDEKDLPPEIITHMAELFTEGVKRWEGVTDEDGKPLDCNPLTILGFPTLQKITVAAAYLNEWGRLQGNARASG